VNKPWLSLPALFAVVALVGCGGGTGSGMGGTPVSSGGGPYLLTVADSGSGTVTSSDGNINCGSVCSFSYNSGTLVTLTATPAQGWTFSGWSGCDSTSGNSCTVTMNSARTATANFIQNMGQPSVTLDTPAAGATQLSGYAYNVDPTQIKVVIYVLTNEWYVQPLIDAPFTNISADGSWTSFTNPWSSIVVLLVNPANYTPAATEITNPALDPNVLAWTVYPSGPVSVSFSGRTWGIKTTGNAAGDQFDPGPNFWSNDPSVVDVAADGLHLKINQINGIWQCGEVYLTQSLGYGTYTVQVASHLDQLDQNTVAAPLFIYAGINQELDNEYSGPGGLIPSPNNAQFVVQPYNVPGNTVRYVQPSTAQFTSQMDWRSDHVTFTTWNGWSSTPASSDIINQWRYTGEYIPPPGQERVHINLWLYGGNAPVSGIGDQMVIHSFAFQPDNGPALSVNEVGSGTVTSSDGNINCGTVCTYNYNSGTLVTLTATAASGWTFASWSGCDSTSGNSCTVTMNSARTVSATFTQITYILTVTDSGSGTVTSSDGNINCGSACSFNYGSGTPVTLTATAASGWTFTSWSGCDSTSGNTCKVTMNSARTVTATFTQITYVLTVATSGSGTVTSSDGNINCGSVCSFTYDSGTQVTLTAAPAQGWMLSSWSGCDSTSGNSCKVTMNSARSVSANFTENYTLTVYVIGSGTVISTDGFINCGSICSHTYASNTQVTLNAAPTQGWTFNGWAGACSGTGSCVVTVTQAGATVTAILNQNSSEQNFTTLVNLGGDNIANPVASLIQATDGNFYGTSFDGGTDNPPNNDGTVFKVTPGDTATVFYSFCAQPNCTDGSHPQGGLVQATDRNFYGTTSQGGTNSKGTVFQITLGGTLTALHSFNGEDGAFPYSGLVQATDGNLYGTTSRGGAYGIGTVFKITLGGTLTTLHSFDLVDGYGPFAGLVQASDRNLYGTTSGGGTYGEGTVFRISLAGSLTTMHSFHGADGAAPDAALVQGTDGNLFGTTNLGGTNNLPACTTNNGPGCGTVFKITLGGTLTTLHSFDLVDGYGPFAGLVQGTDGNFYGTTAGGPNDYGTVFEITPGGTLTTLHSFYGTDGIYPFGGLVQGADRSFYGTTYQEGGNCCGTVFSLSVGLR
jgi:uncharacterized repeat protein (TIGR03803 family)